MDHLLRLAFICVFVFVYLQGCGGCRNGYVRFQDSCYHLSHDKENWVDAMTLCKVPGGNLAEVDSATENSFLTNMLNSHKANLAWIGGNDLDVEGYWTWINSGVNITFSAWAPGEPNNNGSPSEDCLVLQTDYWNDIVCSSLQNYICEMPYVESEIVG